ncbi:MAG TPA: carbamoyltransferase HypF, partial [Gammaproteobacteria bacterium]|nr:carbamoyltransferase HypF [Gammaproteobacteria bacterium]
MPVQTRRWRLAGRVQGVGFRPFVYRLALSHGLRGWVQNRLGQVLVCTEGPSEAQEAFGVALLEQAPPLAEPRLLHVETLPAAGFEGFEIRVSEERGEARVHVPPDYFTCDDCLAELNDPADRRYRYPFINCTQCGPRYTLIRALPYDRANTSMADFPLCPACGREYRDPLDRRFHAEPVACPVCGPSLEFVYGERLHLTDTALALQAALQALRRGRIVAVKGVGGYHLMCDARSDAVVARLRERKQRPHKPLAVMFPAPAHDPLAAIAREVELGAEEKQVLQSPMRPVVLARRKAAGTLSAQL